MESTSSLMGAGAECIPGDFGTRIWVGDSFSNQTREPASVDLAVLELCAAPVGVLING